MLVFAGIALGLYVSVPANSLEYRLAIKVQVVPNLPVDIVIVRA